MSKFFTCLVGAVAQLTALHCTSRISQFCLSMNSCWTAFNHLIRKCAFLDTMPDGQNKATVSARRARYDFTRCMMEGSNFDHFYKKLQELAVPCDFGPNYDELLVSQIICGVPDEVLRQTLCDDGLSLEEVLEKCKQFYSGQVSFRLKLSLLFTETTERYFGRITWNVCIESEFLSLSKSSVDVYILTCKRLQMFVSSFCHSETTFEYLRAHSNGNKLNFSNGLEGFFGLKRRTRSTGTGIFLPNMVVVMSRVSEVENWWFESFFVEFFLTSIKSGRTCLKKKTPPTLIE